MSLTLGQLKGDVSHITIPVQFVIKYCCCDGRAALNRMLAPLRSTATATALLPRLLFSTIGRKPRIQPWLSAGVVAAAAASQDDDSSRAWAAQRQHSSNDARGGRASSAVSANAGNQAVGLVSLSRRRHMPRCQHAVTRCAVVPPARPHPCSPSRQGHTVSAQRSWLERCADKLETRPHGVTHMPLCWRRQSRPLGDVYNTGAASASAQHRAGPQPFFVLTCRKRSAWTPFCLPNCRTSAGPRYLPASRQGWSSSTEQWCRSPHTLSSGETPSLQRCCRRSHAR